jgi:hypothetical protein
MLLACVEYRMFEIAAILLALRSKIEDAIVVLLEMATLLIEAVMTSRLDMTTLFAVR